MEFEWDEEKRRTNLEKHGIEFEEAYPVFDGRERLTLPDPRHVEERFITIADVGTGFLSVVWTPRGGRIRLISVRSASRAERRAYRSHVLEGT